MSRASHLRQQKLIDSIPDDGTEKTVEQLANELYSYYAKREIQKRSVKQRIRLDIDALKSIYGDILQRHGGHDGQRQQKSITVSWKKQCRPINRVALSTAQMITFATIKKMGTHLLPMHMKDSIAVFLNASENEAVAHSAQNNPNVSDKQNRSAAQKWLNKIQSIPERIDFIEPEVSPRIEEDIHRALMDEVAIDIKYRDKNNWQAVSPLGIAQQGARTYLIVKYPKGTTATTLLMARIKDVRQSTALYEVPDGFKLDTFLKKGIAAPNTMFLKSADYGKNIKLKLWVSGDTKWIKETPLSSDQWTELCDKDQPDGDFNLSATVRMTEGLVWWLLSMSYHIKVLGPQHLVKRLQHDLSKAAQSYSN